MLVAAPGVGSNAGAGAGMITVHRDALSFH